MEQILFLVLVAVVGLIRWVLQAAEEKKNKEAAKRGQSPPANASVPRAPAPAQSEEERVRRFLEALGVPTAQTPPKPIPERRQVAPKTPRAPKRRVPPIDPFPTGRPIWSPEPVVVVTPPPVISAPPPLPETAPPPALPQAPVTTGLQPLAPVFDVVVDTRRGETTTRVATTDAQGFVRPGVVTMPVSWSARLASAEGARDAIILREIFGPPRSMQPLDELRAI